MAKLADKITGWQLVVLVGLFLATVVTLVAMGQQLSALVAAGLSIAVALGANVVQVAANQAGQAQKLDQVKDLSNGNLQAARDQLAAKDAHIAHVNQVCVQLAALVPPDKALLIPQIMAGGDPNAGLGGGSRDPQA